MATYDQGRYEKSIQSFDKVRNASNKFHDRALYGQFNAYLNLNQPIEARTCYEAMKDRLDVHEELSARLQLTLLEEYPVDLLKMSFLLEMNSFAHSAILEFKLHWRKRMRMKNYSN